MNCCSFFGEKLALFVPFFVIEYYRLSECLDSVMHLMQKVKVIDLRTYSRKKKRKEKERKNEQFNRDIRLFVCLFVCFIVVRFHFC